MNSTKVASFEPGNRVQIPTDWVQDLGLCGAVTLERTDDGVLIRPATRYTWHEIFASRLSVKPGEVPNPPEVTDVSGDGLLF
jgi:hypothetical protein